MGGWAALYNSVGRASLMEQVILEQRLNGSGERGMACVQEKHVLGGEDRLYQCPKEDACLACLRPVNQEVCQEPRPLGALSQGRAEKEVREITEVRSCRAL